MGASVDIGAVFSESKRARQELALVAWARYGEARWLAAPADQRGRAHRERGGVVARGREFSHGTTGASLGEEDKCTAPGTHMATTKREKKREHRRGNGRWAGWA